MKKNSFYVFAVSTFVFLFAVSGFAQENRQVSAAGNLYVISADAGGVNYVEGKVSVKQNNGRNGYLIKGDKLDVGEKVSTGADGKAEILLNPGSYVRLAGNTDFEFLTTSLEDLQLKLNSGSAMFEVITDNDFNFVVNTPKGSFNIIKSGVYRVDVLGNGSGKIEVWKGRAQVGNGANAIEVKSGRTAAVTGGQVAAVEKFDRDDKDALESWSKVRAKELAKINSRLVRNNLRNTLLNSYNRRGWNVYDSYGLWVFDRFSGINCFLPFGYGWSSPYGYGYGRDLWYMRLPTYIYYQPPTTNQTPQVGTIRSGSGIPSKVGNGGGRRMEAPPYLKVQRDISPSPIYRDDSPSIFNGGSQFPSRSESPQRESSPAPVLVSPTGRPGKGN